MRLNSTSIFYRIPNNLEPRQILLLEAIRYSVNMCFISWDQLRIILKNISNSNSFNTDKYSAFLFAWSVVDNLDRLKSILTTLGVDGLDCLFDSIEKLRSMRNTYHHLYDRIETSLELNHPLLGTLSWTFMDSMEQNTIQVSTIASGRQEGKHVYETLNPLGQTIDVPIGMVTLTSVIQNKNVNPSSSKINLSEVMLELDNSVTMFERHLESQFQDTIQSQDFVQQDVLMVMVFNL